MYAIIPLVLVLYGTLTKTPDHLKNFFLHLLLSLTLEFIGFFLIVLCNVTVYFELKKHLEVFFLFYEFII